MVCNLHDIDIKRLSNIFDADNEDTFISIYLDLNDPNGEKFLEKRRKACRTTLHGKRDLVNNFDATYERALELVGVGKKEKGRGAKSVLIFASVKNDLFEVQTLGVTVDNLMVVDTSPYIRPIARLRDEWETFGLVIVDQQHFQIYVVSCGSVETEERLKKDIMNKHTKGGWSQARFQRLRKNAIDAFLREAAATTEEVMQEEGIARLVVAGPGHAKNDFIEELHPKIQEAVTGVFDYSQKSPAHDAVERAVEMVSDEEKEDSDMAVENLQAEILRNGLAVYGLKETRDAVAQGKAELLLVSKDLKVGGWICEKCQLTSPGARSECPICGSTTSEVDVIEEIIEFAERMDTDIEFVADNEVLQGLGGVAALLRYK